MGGEEEVGAGAGQGDVAEPALLGDAVVGEGAGEPLEGLLDRVPVVLVGPAEPGQAGAVAAQVVGQGRQPDEPALVAGVAVAPRVADDLALRRGVRREGRLDHPRHGDDVPLQALGGVHGHHLDGVGAGLDPAEVEPALLVDGGLEPGEEAAEGGAVGARREVGRDVGEGVEVRAGGTGRVPGPGEHLDVEAEGASRPPRRARAGRRPVSARSRRTAEPSPSRRGSATR